MDTTYFSDLINKYSKKVYNLAYHIVDNREDAEDVVQETFLQVYRSLDTFRGDSHIYTWIYKIALNNCLRFKKYREKVYVEDLEEKVAFYHDKTTTALQNSISSDPENTAVMSELTKQIRNECHQAVMKKLPENQRLVFIMRVVLDLSYQEIARTLDISENVIKARLNRARTNLLNHFQNKCQWYMHGEPSSCCQTKVGYILTQDTESLKRVFEEIREFETVDDVIDASTREIENLEQIYREIQLPHPDTELIKNMVLNT